MRKPENRKKTRKGEGNSTVQWKNTFSNAYLASDLHNSVCMAGTSAASIFLRSCSGRSDSFRDFTMADKVLRSGTEENLIYKYACMYVRVHVIRV